MTRTLFAAALAAFAAVPAYADHACFAVPDPPGAATFVQASRLDNAGRIVAYDDAGSFVWFHGSWSPLPAPPAGYAPTDFGALGINDPQTVVGGGPNGQAFIESRGSYHFFSLPPYTSIDARAVNDQGIVTGEAFDDSGAGPGFIYNPRGIPGWPAGFSTLVATRPDGAAAYATTAAQMNSQGVLVGNGYFADGDQWGFIYDPAATPSFSAFQVLGHKTRARGINDRGEIVGLFFDRDVRLIEGFYLASAGAQPEIITCPELNAAGGLNLQGINDRGEISGQWIDAAGMSHTLVVTPK
jgi:hypothetical protein